MGAGRGRSPVARGGRGDRRPDRVLRRARCTRGNDATRLGSLASDTNWTCGTDATSRSFAWNGSRTNLAGWRTKSGQDGRSLDSRPPTFDANLRVTSANLGLNLGDRLGLLEDYAGSPLPAAGPVDIGAYQHAA